MTKGTVKLYALREIEVQEIGVYFPNTHRYFLDTKGIEDLPPGKYRVRGEVKVRDDLTILVDEELTIGDV